MSEPTTMAAATCTLASGGLTAACMAAMGINPTDMIAGLLGCIAVQSLLHSATPRPFRQIAAITIGGMVLASVLAPLAAPWFVDQFASWAPKVAAESVRAAMAALIAGFAQGLLNRIAGYVRGEKISIVEEAKDA
jgi:hypothetical protein